MTKQFLQSVHHLFVTIFVVVFSVATLHAEAMVKVYPAPADEPLSNHFTVSVEGQNAPVYLAKDHVIGTVKNLPIQPEIQQNGEAGFASFDIDGTVQITVTTPSRVKSARVLPTSRGIKATINGNSITFTVTSPGPLTVEINGEWLNSLHVFVNPMETNTPDPNDPNVIYFAPGIHIVSPLKVGSGKTVYIAGGAVLYGKVDPSQPSFYPNNALFLLEGSNITLRGRGIIDGKMIPDHKSNLVATHGSHIRVEGVVLRDSRSWHLPVWMSQHVKIENVKVLGQTMNADGIDIVNSQDVEVSDSFVKAFDDLIVIKTRFPNDQETRDITIRHNVLWNELAHALSLGAEFRKNIENVKFTDCDIIHDKGRDWLLRVFDTDSGTANNITFDNIRIEEARQLLSLWIGADNWSKDAMRGHIGNIFVNNIRTVAPERPDHSIQFQGFDHDHAIQGVTLSDVIVAGKPVTESDIHRNSFATRITLQNRTPVR